MKLLLNEKELGYTLENEKTVGDLLRSLESECEKNNATIINIAVDGKTIAADEIETLDNVNIDDTDVTSVTTVFPGDIIASLKSLADAFKTIVTQFEELPVLLQAGKATEAANYIKSFADNFDVLCHLTALSTLFPKDFEDKKIDDKPLADFIKDFSGILTEFENAFACSDSVLTGDLAEYEIKPRLENFIEAARSF